MKEYQDKEKILKLLNKRLKNKKLTPHELHILAIGLIDWGENLYELWWLTEGEKLYNENHQN